MYKCSCFCVIDISWVDVRHTVGHLTQHAVTIDVNFRKLCGVVIIFTTLKHYHIKFSY